MSKLAQLAIVSMLVLSLMPIQATATTRFSPSTNVWYDGIGPKKHRKKKVVAKKVAVPVQTDPFIETRWSEDRTQLIFSLFFVPLYTFEMRQMNDKVVAANLGKRTVEEFNLSKDKQIADVFIGKFKTSTATFLVLPGNKSEKNTIVLNKEQWSDEEIAEAKNLLIEKYAPAKVAWAGPELLRKPMEVPSTAVSQANAK